jgi:hypothetical protein
LSHPNCPGIEQQQQPTDFFVKKLHYRINKKP